MATRQQPWASGKHKPSGRRKPASSSGRRILGRVAGNASKKWKRTLRKHPSAGIVASIVLAVIGVALLIAGLLAENLLYFLAMGLSGLGSVAVARSGHLERQRQEMKTGPKVTPPAGARKPRTPPRPEPGAPPSTVKPDGAPTGTIMCTRTNRPTKDCDCSTRGHVVTVEGKRKFGGNYGDPIGARNRDSKTAKVRR